MFPTCKMYILHGDNIVNELEIKYTLLGICSKATHEINFL